MKFTIGFAFGKKVGRPGEHYYNNELRMWLFEDWEFIPLWYVGPFSAMFNWLFISVYLDSRLFRPLYLLLRWNRERKAAK